MRKYYLILTLVLVGFLNSAHAQELAQAEVTQKTPRVLFVLKAGEKSVEIDNRLGNKIKMDDIAVESISSMEVVKDQPAIDQYGDKGKGGVIVIRFKDYESLDEKTQKLFQEKEDR